ncbi:unnamed protein product, partial [Timema podura]|nr:unnamed protein product [Timema podura]
MQDLIPRNSLDTRKDDFVPRLMSYFHSAAELIRARTRGPVQHSLLLALSDVIGGYLHVYVLPLARRGYYCGVVRYKYTRELHDLYDQLLRFLKTDGSNWMKPITGVGSSFPVHPIGVQPLKPSESEQACKQIITYRASGMYVIMSQISTHDCSCPRSLLTTAHVPELSLPTTAHVPD